MGKMINVKMVKHINQNIRILDFIFFMILFFFSIRQSRIIYLYLIAYLPQIFALLIYSYCDFNKSSINEPSILSHLIFYHIALSASANLGTGGGGQRKYRFAKQGDADRI
jgi:hypothetical protein